MLVFWPSQRVAEVEHIFEEPVFSSFHRKHPVTSIVSIKKGRRIYTGATLAVDRE